MPAEAGGRSTDSDAGRSGHGPRWRWAFQVALVLSVVVSSAVPARRDRSLTAEANGLDRAVSRVVPFAGVLVGWSHRNRVYRDAEAFIDDRNEYYDRLRDTARRQLVDRELAGLDESQVSAYIKLVAMIEQERDTELEVAESRKRAAREAFHDRVEGALVTAIAGTDLARDLFDALQEGVGSAEDFVQRAIDKLVEGETGALGEIREVQKIARRVSLLGSIIGGPAGERLRGVADRIDGTIEGARGEILEDLEQVQGDLSELDEVVGTLSRIGRAPSAGAVAAEAGVPVVPEGEAEDPAMTVIAGLLSELDVGDGSLRDEARAAIRAGFVARCSAIAAAYRAELARIRGEDVGQIDVAEAVGACRSIPRGELATAGQPATATPVPPTAAPTATAPPPIVTLKTQIVEGQESPFVTELEMTADFGAGSVSGSLNGARSYEQVFPCFDLSNPEVVYDHATVAYTESYTASFGGSLDPESGVFSAPIAPAGNTSFKLVAPFTDERCVHLNDDPAPGIGPWSGSGTISGTVSRDGQVNGSVQWQRAN